MESSVIRQIHRLRHMTVGELRLEWAKLHGDVMNPSGMCKDYATDWYEFWTWIGPWRR